MIVFLLSGLSHEGTASFDLDVVCVTDQETSTDFNFCELCKNLAP